MKKYIRLSLVIAAIFTLAQSGSGQEYPQKKILIVVEGNTDLKNYAIGDGRQLAELLGHFNTAVTIKGVNRYNPGEINTFDFTFYIGFNGRNVVPAKFLDDVLATKKPIIWMNTGMIEFSEKYNLRKKYRLQRLYPRLARRF